jgi:hypothetical protein
MTPVELKKLSTKELVTLRKRILAQIAKRRKNAKPSKRATRMN